MNWFPIALLTAFSAATTDALIKAGFSDLKLADMMVVRAAAPVPFLVLPLFFMPWPRLGPGFWETMAFLLPLEIFGLFLYMEALKTSPLSLSMPFLSFTPVFMVFTGWFILGERISLMGLAGILCAVAGAYILHLKAYGEGVFGPFKAVMKDRGSRLILLVSVVYAVTGVLGKRAVQESAPFFFACFYFVALGLVIFFIFYLLPWFFGMGLGRARGGPSLVVMRRPAFWAVGLAQSVMVISHMWAIHLVAAAYMIAVKRISIVFSVLYGKLLFYEDEALRRLLGAALMALGAALIMIRG